MKFKLIVLLGCIVLISGCAFSVLDAPVNYTYSGTTVDFVGQDLPRVEITEIEDIRSVANPRMIMHMKNGYGQTTSGGWQAEKDLALIVKDALTEGIAAVGLDRESVRDIRIDGQLIDVTSEMITGWIKGTINMKVSVKLSAREAGKDEILWRDTLVGTGTSGEESSVKPAITEAFRASLDDLVAQLLRDEYFRQRVL